MSHLRNYRTRYINKERQGKPVDIPGDEVLKYIQDCFENCAKNLAVCSPAVSCSSSSTLQQDQDEFPFESEEKEQPEPEICLPNEFNAVSCVLSPNNKDKSPGENVSEDDEESNIGDFLEDDIDILALGSPALIQLDENFEEINAANVDPEGDCEFLIEDSIGMSSRSLVSASQKKQKPQRKDVISAPSGSKKEANKPSLRKIDSNASEKPVPPSLVNQTKMKSTNVAEATAGRLKNISLTSEMMSLIDDQPLLVLNTFQEERQKIHSKGMASKEISNKIPAGINNTEDHVALLEENDSASIQSQPVLGTEESSSNGKGTVKHKHSKTKTSIERQNEENQKNAPVIMDLENNKSFENIGSVLRPILSMEPSEQKSSNKNSQPAGLKSHNKKLLKKQKNPRTAQSEKQPQTQRSAIKEPVIRPTRRKKIVLASDESSETEHEDEHLNKGVKNSNSYKLNKPNHSREASQKRRQTSSNSEGSDCERVSYQEDAVCLTEERLYPSEKQANSTTDSIQNAATVDPEYDCEFLIEESFGMSFRSLISASQKKQQPQRKNVISAPSGSKKVNKPSVRKKDKKTSEKPVPQNLVNQTKIKSTDVAETTVGRLKNVSMTSEIMPLIEDQQLLVLNTSQEGRQNIHSKGVAAEEISSTIPAGINKTENHAALLEENDSASVQSQPVLRTEESSSNGKGAVKHKHSKTKTSVERQNEENQDNAPVIMDFENNQPFENIDTYSEHSDSLLRPILSVEPAEQKPSNKNSQSAGLKSNNKKLLKRQKPPRTAQSKKQPQTQRSAIKESVIRPTRRKKIVLVSDESSETEHEDEHHDKGVKNYSYELKKPNNSREASQKRRQASLISSEDSDCERVSYQEDSFCLTEERLYSEKQSNSTADSLQYSSIPDVNMNNASGPLIHSKKSSKQKKTFDSNESSLGESGDYIDSLDELASNSLKRKLVLPTNTPNVRRTKRMRIKPLEYWRGERVKYRTRPSGGFVFHGIISPEQKEPIKPKSKKTTNPVMELDNMPESSLQDPPQPAVVFDVESNQGVLLQCVNTGTSHLHFINNEAVSIYKYLTTPSFSAGKMILKPLKEKGYQYSYTDTLVFNITKGKILLTLYDQYYHLTVGDYFFIPPGNVYNIRNLLNKECIILFTQLKGKRSECE